MTTREQYKLAYMVARSWDDTITMYLHHLNWLGVDREVGLKAYYSYTQSDKCLHAKGN